MARVPLDASFGVQRAIEELNDEIARLRKELAAASTDLRNASLPVEALQRDVAFLKQLRRIPERGQRAYTATAPLFLDDRLEWASVFEETAIRTVSTDTTVLASDFILLVDCTSGDVAITLPAASLKKGRMIEVKKIDSTVNKVVITAAGSDLIDGFATQDLLAQYEAAPIASDGVSSWVVL